jgi:hypothetical protein
MEGEKLLGEKGCTGEENRLQRGYIPFREKKAERIQE